MKTLSLLALVLLLGCAPVSHRHLLQERLQLVAEEFNSGTISNVDAIAKIKDAYREVLGSSPQTDLYLDLTVWQFVLGSCAESNRSRCDALYEVNGLQPLADYSAMVSQIDQLRQPLLASLQQRLDAADAQSLQQYTTTQSFISGIAAVGVAALGLAALSAANAPAPAYAPPLTNSTMLGSYRIIQNGRFATILAPDGGVYHCATTGAVTNCR